MILKGQFGFWLCNDVRSASVYVLWWNQIWLKTTHFIYTGDAHCFSWILSCRNIIKALQRQISVSFPRLVIYMLWLSKSTINIVAPGRSNNGSKWWSSVWVRGVCVCVCSQAMHQGSHRPGAAHWSTQHPPPQPHVPSQLQWLIPSHSPGDGEFWPRLTGPRASQRVTWRCCKGKRGLFSGSL